jgi:hypothetical protein
VGQAFRPAPAHGAARRSPARKIDNTSSHPVVFQAWSGPSSAQPAPVSREVNRNDGRAWALIGPNCESHLQPDAISPLAYTCRNRREAVFPFSGCTRDEARRIAANPKKNQRQGTSTTNAPLPTKTIIAQLESWRVSMSSKNQTRSLHGNKTKPHSDLARHYREVGIISALKFD